MTVIDIFPDRPRVVPRQKISFNRNRKRKSSSSSCGETNFMPEAQQGCVVGNILAGDSNNLFSMEGNEENLEEKLNSKQIKEKEESIGSSLTVERKRILLKSNRAPVRSRRKSRWKLKFHHQALPPEYLRHYKQQERKRRQSESTKTNSVNAKTKKLSSSRKNISGFRETIIEKVKKNGENPEVTIAKMEDVVKCEDDSHDSERLNIADVVGSKSEDKSSGTSKDFNPRWKSAGELLGSGLPTIPHLNIDVSQNKAFLQNLLTNQIEINKVEKKDRKTTDVKDSLSQFNKMRNLKHEDKPKSYSIPPSGKIMNYSDLPYMGEITLDGIKPRRGRKPKKADICHLIYKNYGQVFPRAPGKSEEDLERKNFNWRPEASKTHENSSQKTKGPAVNSGPESLDSPLPTVSGLINHKEVQNRIINSLLEKRLTQGIKLRNYSPKDEGKPSVKPEEPLNLCIRDLQSLKIKLSRKHGNFYETKQKDSEAEIEIKAEDEIKEEVVHIDGSETEGDSSDDNDEEDDLVPFNLVTTELRESSDDDTFLNFNDQITMTRVKTPPKKAESKAPEVQTETEGNSMLFWPGTNLFLPGASPSPFMCYPKLPELMPPNFSSRKGEDLAQDRKQGKSKAEGSRAQLKRLAQNNNNKPAQVITKRKRSAIFIPPVPAETTTNSTTEVSICKFKFTGGAKPSLQEKKMLSVDSGGNFRYYSGTGDKSMRGYEYFPRESLQQCQENTGCSPSGVFLTAASLGSGEKIPEEIGHSEFFDPDFPIQVPTSKQTQHPKPKLKVKTHKKSQSWKNQTDASRYRTLREHLLASKPEPSDCSLLQDDVDKNDGNSSDQSGEGFDWRSIPQSYFDNFKLHEDAIKDVDDVTGSRKLRKTRKSLAREKLEQTFKEKGFLIQTQQLESAEGATYCKFRQLRKFTRYLFRSWKDYLPGNVRNLSVDAGVENPEIKLDFPEGDVKETDLK